MLERVFVCLLAGGHLLIEGVPGLAKTLTVKTLADVFGGTFERIQFTPDLVPADLVGTRMYRQREREFDIELGPVFCNFLLADEINRAPAKVQSALLEVMQERQVTIGKQTYPVPRAVPRDGDAEPDRVRGHVPAARGAGRPLHAQDRRRLPARGRRADGHRARARRPGQGRAARLDRAARGAAAADAPRLRRPGRVALRARDRARDAPARASTGSASSRSTSRTAPARAARSTSCSAPARWPCCAAAATCCRRTSASSPRTCSATAWC